MVVGESPELPQANTSTATRFWLPRPWVELRTTRNLSRSAWNLLSWRKSSSCVTLKYVIKVRQTDGTIFEITKLGFFITSNYLTRSSHYIANEGWKCLTNIMTELGNQSWSYFVFKWLIDATDDIYLTCTFLTHEDIYESFSSSSSRTLIVNFEAFNIALCLVIFRFWFETMFTGYYGLYEGVYYYY